MKELCFGSPGYDYNVYFFNCSTNFNRKRNRANVSLAIKLIPAAVAVALFIALIFWKIKKVLESKYLHIEMPESLEMQSYAGAQSSTREPGEAIFTLRRGPGSEFEYIDDILGHGYEEIHGSVEHMYEEIL